MLNFDRTPEPFVIGQKMSLSFSEQIVGTFTGMLVALRGKAEEVRGLVEDASEIESGKTEISTPPQPAAVVDFDFDGDGIADPGRWNSAAASYRIRQSSNGSFVDHQIGSSSAKAAPGDFDGDGSTDPASFDAGTWTIKQSSNSQTVTFSFGQSGDIPMVGDFEGDGKDDATVFRPSNSTWYVRESSTTNTVTTQFGQSGDVPVSGDFDGDGKADIAVYRPSTGYWWIQGSTAGLMSLQWGASTDVAVPADFDGDGKTDPAVFRPSTGTWYVLKSIGGYANNIIQGWGNYADQPVPADYDGDGKADFAIWRPSTGVWHIRKSYDSSTANYGVGVAGDVAVASAYVKQVGGSLAPYELAKERLKPRNATGGTDLYSQNFAWGRSLVGLPGRAGLDVGLGLSYNSLVWTKENDTLYFDTNVDNVSPGFRLGFPTIEPAYFVPGGIANDPYWAYVMVTPSGGRVEFKQSGVTKNFETTDSSYLQLEADAAPDPNIPVDDVKLTLRGTDGSVMKFVWAGGAFRCTEIKDRSGNYIEIEHDELGLLRTITDTLGREIDVNYDSELFPTSISQSWKTNNGEYAATTHNWAEFEYTTIYPNTDFADGLAVAGPPNGWPVKALHRVVYPDDSFTVFHYNNYAQVWKVENFAADDTLLNHVRSDLQSPAADQTDVPRFTETNSWVQNFNGGNETKVTFERTPNSSFSLPGSISGTGLLIEAELDNDPYASVTKTWIGETGWQEGLPLASEDHAKPVEGGTVDRQRWSWTNWTQDDVNASEQMNPRVVETRIGDDANTKRTTVEYLEYEDTDTAIFGLVSKVKVYDHTGTYPIKEQRTDYNLSSTYLDRRIIGLPTETSTYGWNDLTNSLKLASKLTYGFDEEDFTFETNQVISPIRHDTANFGSSFVAGRGNLTSITRHDVDSQTAAVTTKTRYDIAGSVVSRLDPLNRKVRFEYSDAFNDDVNRNSFAYPTKVYDPANNFSEAKYRFDIGANVWARSPGRNELAVGKTTARLFDSIGRLEKETIVNSGAYTRYAYPTNGVQSQVYTTIVDTNNNNTGDTSDEVLSETWTDGAGRVRRSRTEHPGSIGGWVGSIVEYDILGRTKRSSVPTEISVPNVNNPDSWVPAGDDDRGLDGNGNPIWLWTHQRYDWMGRVVRRIATDGDPNALENDSDVLISYAGCGCAGGLETTIQGELVPRTDGTSGNARRKQKVYQDMLGRTFKTETYNWNGTVYSTSLASFNERDQVLRSRQFEGDTSSTTFQDTTATFDGHGRMASSHRPEQRDSSNNLKYTTYNYNADDSISSVTDGRGAVTNYTYENSGGTPLRPLLTGMSWSVPQGSGIPVPASVTMAYDNAGNRTQMTDGLGSVTYEYDDLSRMEAEVREITALSSSPNNGLFRLEYTYTLGGQLKSLKDPFGYRFDYSHDKVARLQKVDSPTAFNGISTYAENPVYTARGTLAGLEYGNGTEMSVTAFNSRLQATAFEVKKDTTTLISKQYDFNADGSLKSVDDMLNATFDRSYKYDQMGRTVEAKAGTAARGDTPTGPHNLDQPYSRQYSHNAFGQITSFNGLFYGSQSDYNVSFTNGRNSQWTYDAEGNVLADIDGSYQFDAAGRLVKTTPTDVDDEQIFLAPMESHFDGTGQVAKRVRNAGSTDPAQVVNYFISSSVLGQVISETNGTGAKLKTFVHANGAMIAEQVVTEYQQTSYEILRFVHQDASGSGVQQTTADGTLAIPNGRTAEYDAMGRNVADPGPYITLDSAPTDDGPGINLFGNGEGYRPGRRTITINGWPIPESEFSDRFSMFAFNFVFAAARMSTYEVGRWYRTTTTPGIGTGVRFSDEDDSGSWAPIEEPSVETRLLSIVYNTSWSFTTLTMPQIVVDPDLRPFEEKWKKGSVKTALDQAIKATEKKKCDEALKEHGIPSLRALVSRYLEAGGWENHIFDGRNKEIRTLGSTGFISLGKDPRSVPAFVVGRGTQNARTGLNSQFFNITTLPSMARAIILLHEAVHHFGNKADTDFGRTSSEGSQKITKAIVENCFPVAKDLIKELQGI